MILLIVLVEYAYKELIRVLCHVNEAVFPTKKNVFLYLLKGRRRVLPGDNSGMA